MIEAAIGRNPIGQVVSFEVSNHGESHVCAAVSMLVINTVNGIEALTQAEFSCDCNEEDGGYLSFTLNTPREEPRGQMAGLLLDVMVLGLESAATQHPDELIMKAK
ncbi:MAG: ribosomal-processing cysteine protease Prp [Defluviitaleaceae bacterium]|nr:ribosomal-processing cysteine protease Prp [Defluviitaleaceae bacterium]